MFKITQSQVDRLTQGSRRKYISEMRAYFRREFQDVLQHVTDPQIDEIVENNLAFCERNAIIDEYIVMRMALVAVLVNSDFYHEEHFNSLMSIEGVSAQAKCELFCDQMEYMMADIAAGRI